MTQEQSESATVLWGIVEGAGLTLAFVAMVAIVTTVGADLPPAAVGAGKVIGAAVLMVGFALLPMPGFVGGSR